MSKAMGVIALLALAACGPRPLGSTTPGEGSPANPGAAGSSAGGAGGRTATAGATGTASGGVVGTAGAPATPLRISGSEALRRIAPVLWNQQPDDDLNVAATPGRLATTADLAIIIEQMLADPRAAEGVGAFYRWWLELDRVATLHKDPMLFPDFTPALQADMVQETIAFGVDTTLNDDSFQTLMTASWSFINERLASLYGVAGVIGDDLRRVPLPAGQRAGLLTQPALQALGSLETRNSPSHRGSYILNRFYCQQIPFPPASLPPFTVPPGMTVRAALVADVQMATCNACHIAIDPPGLAFEGFDAIGRARTTDNGAPVDTTGRFLLPSKASFVEFYGPVDLAKIVATDSTAENCMAKQWLSFALGRAVGEADQPSVTKVDAAFAASAFNLKALIVAVLTSDAFLTPR
ncbi:MAG: Cellulose-binding domain protein [Myxococcales bacterium]|nr:Cellulose-binding domain protein [Myxococcales bacterium]